MDFYIIITTHRSSAFFSVITFQNLIPLFCLHEVLMNFRSVYLKPQVYAASLFCLFQIELDKIVTHRNSIYERLSQPVITLDELNSAFQLLQELGDMENTIDDIYLPVENIYAKLRYWHIITPVCPKRSK